MIEGMREAAPPPEKPPAKASRRKSATGDPGRTAAPRARGGEARAIADLVPAVGDTAFRRFGFVQSSIITRWPEIVGTRLSRVTSPESLRFPVGKKAAGTLSIAVRGANATIVQHIVPDIIARVNRFFGYGAVAHVRLVQGQAVRTRAARPPEPKRAAVSPASLQPATTASLRAIDDPELRAVLEGLASSLARRDGQAQID